MIRFGFEPGSLARRAAALVTLRALAEQFGLALLVFLLSIVWLRLPDASALDVAATVALAVLIAIVAGAGESHLMLLLAGQPVTRRRLVMGTVLILLSIGVWFGWSALLDHFHGDDEMRAGYINSQLPHALRYFFTYTHLTLWFRWMWSALAWIGAGVLAIFVFALTASAQPAKTAVRALRSLTYWTVLVFGTLAVNFIAGTLTQWTPGLGLGVELVSLVFRFGVSAVLAVSLAVYLLAILAACAREADGNAAAQSVTDEGTPEVSQLRTVENP